MEIKELEKIILEKVASKLKDFQEEKTQEEQILLRTVKLNEEVGELCGEILKKLGNHRKLFEKENLKEEFADVIITTVLLAYRTNIDLEEALNEKIKKIQERQ